MNLRHRFLSKRRILKERRDPIVLRERIAELEKELDEALVPPCWLGGTPPKIYSDEWFIAVTTYGDRVVLKELPETYAYDFKTADETYIKADRIAKWMQFPDSNYKSAANARIASLEAVVREMREALKPIAGLRVGRFMTDGCRYDFRIDAAWIRCAIAALASSEIVVKSEGEDNDRD